MAISTVGSPVPPALTGTVLPGLKPHEVYDGSLSATGQARVKTPWAPLSGWIASMNCAVWPLEIVTEEALEGAAVKLKAMPVSGVETACAKTLLPAVKKPLRLPALEAEGAKATPTWQFLPGAKLAGQLLLAIWKPAVTATAKLVSVGLPLGLVSVMICGLLTCPAPVSLFPVEKSSQLGCASTSPGNPPVPLKATLAVLEADGDETVSVPVTVPSIVGEKITLAVQLAPAARLAPQVLEPAATAKGAEAVKATEAAAVSPLLVTVTVCAALLWPGVTMGKVI